MANEFMNAKMDALNTSMRKVEEDLSAIVPGINSLAKASGKTLYTENTTPYTFRKTPSEAVSTEKVKEIVGASVGWNQLAVFETGTTTVNGVTFQKSTDKITVTGTASPEAVHAPRAVLVIAGHKYLLSGGLSSSIKAVVTNVVLWDGNRLDTGSGAIVSCKTSGTAYVGVVIASGTVCNEEVLVPQLIDLTQMFGTTIADYIYSLETATAGAGVEWIRENCPSLLEYHEYDAGSIKSVNTSGHKVVGKNLLTDEKYLQGHLIQFGYSGSYSATNYTGFFLAGTYTFSFTATDNDQTNLYVMNADTREYMVRGSITKKYTFTISKDGNYAIWLYKVSYTSVDVITSAQLELGSTATTYEPYHGITYPVSQTDLRGVFSLSDGKLVANGDVYAASGQVIRKFGIIDLGTITWVKNGNDGLFLWDNPQTTDNMQLPSGANIAVKAICSKYPTATYTSHSDKSCYTSWTAASAKYFAILDSEYASASAADFKTAMSGVYLVYELATPTTETLEPYAEEQYCSPYGTEEWVGSDVPVGHVTEYASNDSDKLKTLMGSFGGDGLYLVRQENGVTALVPIPDPSSKANGIYSLKATVSSGVVTYNWS